MKVPTYDAPTVGANTLPQPNFRAAQFDGGRVNTLRPVDAQDARGINTPDISGRQLQQTGDQMQRVGQQIAAYQIEAEKEVARVRIDDAMNKAREASLRLTHDKDAGYLRFRGINALERPDGKSLEDEYSETLKKQFDEISGSLGTDAQKAMFTQRAGELESTFRAGLMRHTSDEYNTHRLSVAQDGQKLYIQQIAAEYSNPASVSDALEGIKAQIYQEAQITGKSAEWQQARYLELASSAHRVAVAAAIQDGDIEQAQGYLSKHSKEIEPADRLPLDRAIKIETNNRLGAARAELHLQGVQSSVDPDDFDRVVNITIQTESGGNPNAVSPKGAKGLMQVMDYTNKDPGFGVKPAQDDSQAERVRVGKDYMRAMIKEFGRVDVAWAAYNGGPGAVKKAMKQAEQAADKFRGVGPDDYLAYMPKETRDYVAKNMEAFESGGGTTKARTMQEIDAGLRSDPMLANNPMAYKAARERAETVLRDINNAKKTREDEAFASAIDAIESNGGSYAAIPIEILNAVPRDKLGSLRTHAEKKAKGEKTGTDWDLYYELRTDQKKLSMTNLGAFKDKLSDTEFKQLVDLQQPKDVAKTTVIRSSEEVLRSYMLQAGIDPNSKSEKGAEKAGRVFSEFEQRLNAFESEQGKKATSKDAELIAARMFTQVTVGKNWWPDKNIKEMDASPEDLARVVDVVVPDPDRKLIIEALDKMKRPVNEENIKKLYRQQRGF